jgi:hypothetical protein
LLLIFGVAKIFIHEKRVYKMKNGFKVFRIIFMMMIIGLLLVGCEISISDKVPLLTITGMTASDLESIDSAWLYIYDNGIDLSNDNYKARVGADISNGDFNDDGISFILVDDMSTGSYCLALELQDHINSIFTYYFYTDGKTREELGIVSENTMNKMVKHRIDMELDSNTKIPFRSFVDSFSFL